MRRVRFVMPAQVIPFPVPPAAARPILQPSIYARGSRNFTFTGQVDEWHAPGVLVGKGETRSAVDCAWLVERVLGAPRRRPEIWPGVPGAREAVARIAAEPLYSRIAPFQREGAAFLAERDYAILTDEMGCVDGDAIVHVNRARRGITMTLRELYACWTRWDHRIPTKIRVNANGSLRQHAIDNVLPKGVRTTVCVTTRAGKSIRVTPDHELMCPDGTFTAARDLAPGQRILMNGQPACKSCGYRNMHGGRAGRGGLIAFVPHEDEVVSVVPSEAVEVFDVVCTDPHRNFVANGFIVHNCGKTPQALLAAEARLSLGHVPNIRTPVVLILCPAIAKQHWANEVRKWTGHASAILESLTPDLYQINERYVICNYDILYGGRQADAAGVVHEVKHLPGWGQFLTGRFLVAILDEVHILRGRASRRAKQVKSTLTRVPCVWGLSGTPMPNYVRDLYSIVDIISDGLFGYSYWRWAQAYCNAYQGQYGWVDTGASRIDELNGRLTFFMLGRSAKTVKLELPEKRREIFRVDVRASAPSVAEGNKALNKQNAVGAALRYTARAKRPAVVESAVEALRAKQKVVVFVYMREQADAIAKDIRKHVDCNVMAVSGDLEASGRFAQAQMFRESTAPAAFVATIDSMTVSLSLVGAHLVIFGDLVHEPWKLLQAEKRCHRFDSVERVLVRYMIAAGTIDDAMVTNVIEKIPVIEQTVGSTEDAGELTKMLGGKSTEEILDSLFQSLLAPKESA